MTFIFCSFYHNTFATEKFSFKIYFIKSNFLLFLNFLTLANSSIGNKIPFKMKGHNSKWKHPNFSITSLL
jgi:hypothetical protein